jgi:hypothetical protein
MRLLCGAALLVLSVSLSAQTIVTGHEPVTIAGHLYSEPAYTFVQVNVGDAKQIDVRRFACLCQVSFFWSAQTLTTPGVVVVPVANDANGSQWIEVVADGRVVLRRTKLSALPKVTRQSVANR